MKRKGDTVARNCAVITVNGVRHVVQRTPHGIYIDTAPIEHFADRVRDMAEAALIGVCAP
jgi:hypothetical protein